MRLCNLCYLTVIQFFYETPNRFLFGRSVSFILHFPFIAYASGGLIKIPFTFDGFPSTPYSTYLALFCSKAKQEADERPS